MALQLEAIVDALGGELHGDGGRMIERLAPLQSATAEALSFLSNPKFAKDLAASQAGCVIVSAPAEEAARLRGDYILTPDPYLYFARLTQLWKARHAPPEVERIHPSAVIHPTAQVDETARVGPLCVVERGARIGAQTVLKASVTVSENCVIGARCLLHPGVVIGADGFGLAPSSQGWVKIEQLGAVRIGDDVEIGANTCIDRGALDDTVIEDGVKLDNLIQIGHNVHVGRNTAMAACTGVAGSARIGANCTVGGAGMISGHLTLVDGVHVTAGTLVSRSILKPGHYTGFFPFDDNAAWEKNAATLRNLHALRERVKVLEKALARNDDKTS
ncbi:UDP-3-O-(3-hydroxymyristoyl)glucosamine N-acyltransferase [Variovorax dokdonensis]|uniref:UDP-3-O-acylglucosamine N-acyltransferase n=1 Tax=Variovorax dokdonensis TaxID=344883 RepID=A0ABT7N8S4_9BURK|nr:UDP-3-O-(3-hydroxymyristoyl)glucosamine N-acyltransferase [Variovorax dokdonensis]MDM0044322.1 UDP-3-O-(3-hydroxymyristoyl)glucosamine N-acyltransferase [Variovorax dokdonensis]